MEPVKTEFMQDENSNEYTACQPDGQSGKIDNGINFMSQYIPEKDSEKVTYHAAVI